MKPTRLKLFCILTAIMLLITCLPFTAQAATTYKSPKRIKSGTYIDLNGDGKKEKVTFTKRVDEWGGTMISSVKIGKKAYKTASKYTYDIFGGDIWSDVYTIDLNKKDKYKEVVILLEGVDNYNESIILRYTGSRLLVKHFPGYIQTTGAGKLRYIKTVCSLTSLILYYKYYKLRTGFTFKSAMPKWSSIFEWSDCQVDKLAKSTKVYKKASRSSSTFTIKAGTRITLEKTDRKHWIKLKTKSGKTGFIYLKTMDADYVSPGRQEVWGRFKNRYM